MKRSSLIYALIATVIAFLFGLVLHFFVIYLRDNGSSFGNLSFRGNGALVVLLLALVGLVAGEIVLLRRREWLAAILMPVALVLGLFVVAGSF